MSQQNVEVVRRSIDAFNQGDLEGVLDGIELVDTARWRGAIEHCYRALVRPFFSDSDWGKAAPVRARSLTGVIWYPLGPSAGAQERRNRSVERFLSVEAAGTAPASAEHPPDACYECSRRSLISATG